MSTTAPGCLAPAGATPNPGLTPMMLHHAAWVTHDVAATADFYTRIMGMELVSTVFDTTTCRLQMTRFPTSTSSSAWEMAPR